MLPWHFPRIRSLYQLGFLCVNLFSLSDTKTAKTIYQDQSIKNNENNLSSLRLCRQNIFIFYFYHIHSSLMNVCFQLTHDGMTIVLFSEFKKKTRTQYYSQGSVECEQNFTFWLGHVGSLDGFKFVQRKSSYGTAPGMVGEGGPRISSVQYPTDINKTVLK